MKKEHCDKVQRDLTEQQEREMCLPFDNSQAQIEAEAAALGCGNGAAAGGHGGSDHGFQAVGHDGHAVQSTGYGHHQQQQPHIPHHAAPPDYGYGHSAPASYDYDIDAGTGPTGYTAYEPSPTNIYHPPAPPQPHSPPTTYTPQVIPDAIPAAPTGTGYSGQGFSVDANDQYHGPHVDLTSGDGYNNNNHHHQQHVVVAHDPIYQDSFPKSAVHEHHKVILALRSD